MNIDRQHNLVRRYHVSNAAQHDSQAGDHLLMQGNTGSGVWAGAACRSEETEAKLHARKLKSHIQRKGQRGKPRTGGPPFREQATVAWPDCSRQGYCERRRDLVETALNDPGYACAPEVRQFRRCFDPA